MVLCKLIIILLQIFVVDHGMPADPAGQFWALYYRSSQPSGTDWDMHAAGLGATLLKQGKVDEAKTLITKAATLTFVKLGERHQQSLDAMNWLAECKSTQRNT